MPPLPACLSLSLSLFFFFFANCKESLFPEGLVRFLHQGGQARRLVSADGLKGASKL